MSLRQEPIVLGLTAAFLALLLSRMEEEDGVPRGGSSPPEFEHWEAPSLDRALVSDSSGVVPLRSLFAPPTNTRPLPPLALEEPPRDDLPGVRPPSHPGPASAHWGGLLRAQVEVVRVPGLFVQASSTGGGEDGLAGEERRSANDLLADALQGLGYAVSDGDSGDIPLTPDERSALLESWGKEYDWIELDSPPGRMWGRIENPDRFGLLSDARAAEEVLFSEVDPVTGDSRGAMAQFPWERGLIKDFGFARTPVNDVELRYRTYEGGVTPGNSEELLAFAGECIALRLEVGRALSISEELLRALCAADEQDLRPRLELARCLEAGFRFEEAFQLYSELLERWGHHPEPHVRLAGLEARMWLFESAEERLRQGLRVGRGSWEAHHGMGRFLLDSDRQDEALPYLEQAVRYAPNDPAQRDLRVLLRCALGEALLANGRVGDALEVYRQARNADPDSQDSLAGILACLYVDATLAVEDELPDWVAAGGGADLPSSGLGFELLLAAGMWSLQQGDFGLARDRLLDASQADPLQAGLALRALSWLAERTDHTDEAWRWIEEAREADPTDTWTHYQRARLLAQRDDWESARVGFQRALERELDFEDALLAQGELAFRLGRFEDAERFLERAVWIGEPRADALALRGLNFLQLGRIEDARESFLAARNAEPRAPVALNGLAWCEYLLGEPVEATVQLRALDDMRRDELETDPHRVWALTQIDRILKHLEKEAWIDDFERGDNSRLRNDWSEDESLGPDISLVDGSARIEGAFEGAGQARLYRELRPGQFESFEADVWISASTRATAGLFIVKERAGRGGATEPLSGVSVMRHRDGVLQWKMNRRTQVDEAVDVEWLDDFRVDRWVRLRMARSGELGDDRITISVEGTPIVEEVPMKQLFSGTQELKIGLFVSGDPGRACEVLLDNVELVRRKML